MKRFLSFWLCIAMLLAMAAGADLTVAAAGDSIAEATAITFDKTYQGSITEDSKKDVYRFEITGSGNVEITLSAEVYRTNYYLYDAASETIWSSTENKWNENTKKYQLTENWDLIKGECYFCVEGYYHSYYGTLDTGNYQFEIYDPNDRIAAGDVGLDGAVNATDAL